MARRPVQSLAEKHHVNVSASPGIIGKIPSWVVRVLIEDDWVAIPQPIVAEADVSWGNTEIEPAEPETLRSTAFEAPHMSVA